MLAEVDHLTAAFPLVSITMREPPAVLTLVGGIFDDVRAVLTAASVHGAPEAISVVTWQPGAVELTWSVGALDGTTVRVRWVALNARAMAEQLEARSTVPLRRPLTTEPRRRVVSDSALPRADARRGPGPR